MKNYDNFLFDLDGTLYTGRVAVPDADKLMEFLRNAGRNIWFISNNSNQTPAQIARKLCSMGIEAAENQIITPLLAAGEYISQKYGRSRIYVAGSMELQNQLRLDGHQVNENTGFYDVVLIGRDLEFNYDKLAAAARWIQRGAKFIAANADLSHPGAHGLAVPETGAMAAAVSAVCACPYESIGKPESFLYDYITTRHHLQKSTCLMIGDNPSTDIAGGQNAGIDTCLLYIARENIVEIPSGSNMQFKNLTSFYNALQNTLPQN